MTQFKVGDKVRVRPAFAASQASTRYDLNTGRDYTVSDVSPGGVKLSGNTLTYNACRFELVPDQFKTGDKVVVRKGMEKSEYDSDYDLVAGQVYEVDGTNYKGYPKLAGTGCGGFISSRLELYVSPREPVSPPEDVIGYRVFQGNMQVGETHLTEANAVSMASAYFKADKSKFSIVKLVRVSSHIVHKTVEKVA